MKTRKLWGGGGCVLFLILILFVGRMPVQPALAQSAEVSLRNPSFEGDYVEWSQRVWVADGWTPIHWGLDPMIDGGSGGRSSQPEYKPLPKSVDPYRVRSGERSQSWFWFYTHGDAAVYQDVYIPTPGFYRVSVWAQAWTSDVDDAPHDSPGEMYVSVGIDPEGRDPGGWPWATSVVWSPFRLVREQFVNVESLVVQVKEQGEVAIYLRAWKKWDQKHGDIYFDDVRMMRLDLASPAETPEPCPTCPAPGTPEPCDTPVPGGGERCPGIEEIEAAIRDRAPVVWPR